MMRNDKVSVIHQSKILNILYDLNILIQINQVSFLTSKEDSFFHYSASKDYKLFFAQNQSLSFNINYL
jgi:hypothetical protein